MKHKVLLVLLLGIIISVSASAQKVTMNLKQVKAGESILCYYTANWSYGGL